MNKIQKIIISIYIASLILTFLFPPCICGSAVKMESINKYKPIYNVYTTLNFSDEKKLEEEKLYFKIDTPVLFAEIAILTLICGSLILYFKDKR